MEEFAYQELVEATESFSPTRLVGRGSHGSIYRATLGDERVVAVKKAGGGEGNAKLDNEIRVLLSLRGRAHPHVVNLLGTSLQKCSEKERKLLVMEFMPNGTLHDLLHVGQTPPTWAKRIEIALHVARALQFLHAAKPQVIHRDVKSANILFDRVWIAKLADFGLATAVTAAGHDDSGETPPSPAGTMGYLDPSYTTPDGLGPKVDVFSFGVLLLEIVTGREAVDVRRTPASLVEWAVPLINERRGSEICDPRTALPPCMEAALERVLGVAERCVAAEENRRPSSAEIAAEMEAGLVEFERGPRRLSIWVGLLRSLLLVTWRPKVSLESIEAQAQTGADVSAAGKLLLKEVLADVTFA